VGKFVRRLAARTYKRNRLCFYIVLNICFHENLTDCSSDDASRNFKLMAKEGIIFFCQTIRHELQKN